MVPKSIKIYGQTYNSMVIRSIYIVCLEVSSDLFTRGIDIQVGLVRYKDIMMKKPFRR